MSRPHHCEKNRQSLWRNGSDADDYRHHAAHLTGRMHLRSLELGRGQQLYCETL